MTTTTTTTTRRPRGASKDAATGTKRPARRPAKKTGDPQADRTARDAKAAEEAASAATPAATHEFTLVNGVFEVHKAGCKDVARDLRKSDYQKPGTGTWTTEDEAIRDLWSDMIAEQVTDTPDADLAGYYSETSFNPCCKLTAPAAPKVDKRAAKQDLARRILMAVSYVFESADGSEAFLAGMTKDEAARCVAHWLHHLPTGSGEDGKRVWPGVLPRPDRSDWR